MNGRRLVVGLLAAVALAGGAVYVAGAMLVASAHRKVPPPPSDLRAQSVILSSSSGAQLAAWLVTPDAPVGAVVVLHGVRANRADMVSRVELLSRAGYIVLAPDLQGHGESTGAQITFGYLESRDAESCLGYLRNRFPALPIGGVGVSLGGAAFALAGSRSQAQALVLEAVYPTTEEAAENRLEMRIGPAAHFLTPLLLLQLRPRLGIGAEDLRPIQSIQALRCPVLVMSGTADRHTTQAQTEALYAAANAPKELWLVPGAAHVDLLRYDRAGYSAHVLGFFGQHLARGNASGRTSALRQ